MDMYKDPCCGLSLYRGVKVIAIIDLVASVFSSVLSGFGFLIALFDGDAIMNDLNNYNATQISPGGTPPPHIGAGWIIFSLLAMTMVNIFYVFLARYLLHATQERNTLKLQRWFDITAVVLAIRLLGYIPMLFMEGGVVILFGITWCAYTAYSLWVVRSLKKQLLTEGESNLLRDAVYYSPTQKL